MGTRRNYWSDSAHSWLRTHIQVAGRQEKKVQVASPRPAEVVFNTQAPLASLFIHLNDSPAPAHSHPHLSEVDYKNKLFFLVNKSPPGALF